MTKERGAGADARRSGRERLRTRSVTALLLTAAMLFALVRSAGG